MTDWATIRRKIWLVELRPEDDQGNVLEFDYTTQTLLFAGSDPDRAGRSYERRLMTPLEHETHMFEGDSLFGLYREGFGGLTINNGDRSLDHWVDLRWRGRRARVLVGSKGWAYSEFQTVVDVQIRDIQLTQNGRSWDLFFRDAVDLDQPIAGDIFAGDNGVSTDTYEGESGLAGQRKPLRFGSFVDEPGVMVNTLSNTYQLHNGSVAGNVVAKVNGYAWNYAGDFVGAAFDSWGSAPGEYATDNGRGLVKFGGATGGTVTFDFDGAVDDQGNHIVTHADLVRFFALRWHGSVDELSFASHSTAVIGPIRMRVDDEISRRELLGRVLQSCGSHLGKTREGLVTINPVELPTGPATVTLNPRQIFGAKLVRRIPPVSKINYGEGVQPQEISADPAAEELAITSLFANDADRETEGQRVAGIRNAWTQIWEIEVYMQGFAVVVGDVIFPQWKRFFDGSKQFRVISVREFGQVNRSILRLWG